MNTVYKIEKQNVEGIELLPDETSTELFKEFNDGYCTDRIRCLYQLYVAIKERENYFQINDPTAFGDPQYQFYCGKVIGILISNNLEEIENDGYIRIRKNGKTIMQLGKVVKPDSYYESIKDIHETMKALGF